MSEFVCVPYSATWNNYCSSCCSVRTMHQLILITQRKSWKMCRIFTSAWVFIYFFWSSVLGLPSNPNIDHRAALLRIQSAGSNKKASYIKPESLWFVAPLYISHDSTLGTHQNATVASFLTYTSGLFFFFFFNIEGTTVPAWYTYFIQDTSYCKW